MAQETQKQTIYRLSNELVGLKNDLNEWKVLVTKLNSEIADLTQAKDDIFQGSNEYEQMKKRILFLEQKNKSLKNTITHDNNIHKLINKNKPRNERGAGRKSKFTDQEKKMIKMYRLQGKTIKEIAEMFGCSTGLIHKLISEINN